MKNSTENEIVRPRGIQAVCGISAKTAGRLEKRGEFPGKIKLSSKAVGYLRCELEVWRESRRQRAA